MSTSEIYLCIILALCVPKGGAEMFYRKSGQDVVMNCGDAAQNSDLEWKHSDELILRINGKSGRMMKGASSVAGKAKITGTKLVINLLGTKDSGLYSCTGQNKIGTKNTWQHKLHVVSVIASPADVVLDSTEVTLTCDIPEDSTVEVQWMRPPDLKPFGYHGKTVTLKSVSLADAGHWVCQVKDEQGVELNIGLDITVVGPLMSTEEIVVIPGDTAELPCFLPNLSVLTIIGGGWVRHPPNGTDFLTLETQGKNLHWSDTNTMPRIMLFAQHLSTNFSVTLTNVQSADAGVYVCTLMFEGKEKLKANLRLKVEGEAVSRSSKTFWEISVLGLKLYAWVAIAAGSVILIILFVVIMFFYRRNKRMRRKVRKLKSMREPLTSRNYCQCNRTERPHAGKREKPAPLPRTDYYPFDT
uniref:Ig-like domain-containing protein n=2 Tax=Electrophorus electricus TaxID=8005 RepID=A0A4W4FN59_ELEEL